MTIVMMGATGEVGGEVVERLLAGGLPHRLTLLGRRPAAKWAANGRVRQHVVDIFQPASYRELLPGHDTAICTLGIGQPSKVSREEYVRVDKQAVLDFATAAKKAGVEHFELLSSVGADSASRSWYLRVKGELEDGLKALGFARLSLFHPSMILTPTNRYGLSQGILLKLWPVAGAAMIGPLRRFRGIRSSELGSAMAVNTARPGSGVEDFEWDGIKRLLETA